MHKNVGRGNKNIKYNPNFSLIRENFVGKEEYSYYSKTIEAWFDVETFE